MISSQCTYLTSEILPQAGHWRFPPGLFQIIFIRKINFWFRYVGQTIFIGNNSIISSLVTSIINGIYLIVIKQILLSHDIYYRSRLDLQISAPATKQGMGIGSHWPGLPRILRSLLLQRSTPKGYILLKFIKIFCVHYCSNDPPQSEYWQWRRLRSRGVAWSSSRLPLAQGRRLPFSSIAWSSPVVREPFDEMPLPIVL